MGAPITFFSVKGIMLYAVTLLSFIEVLCSGTMFNVCTRIKTTLLKVSFYGPVFKDNESIPILNPGMACAMIRRVDKGLCNVCIVSEIAPVGEST